jgi:diaminopimelate epimerase
MSCFPERTNVEFVEVLNRHRIRVRFWERGVGPTPASGTGGSAAAVAAILNGLAASPVTVEAELGNLLVRWEPPDELRLTGPAEFICSCDWEDGTGA